MENINGALGFAATLDIDQFNVSAQAMEQSIRNSMSGATDEVGKLEARIMDMARTAAGYITSYLTAQGMYGLMQSIIATRGQFQQLEMAFETMLGSGSKAHELMNQMTETAAKTPFDLAGVAGGAKQLLAYGVAADKVNDTLVRLGNIASGLSIPLNDIVYLYGTTMVQGRLYAQDVRQFTGRGIPLVKELAAMYGVNADEINNMVSAGKIGFPQVETVINKLTDAGGQFYNLIQRQSSSLTGMIANLGDAWDMALNDIGTENQEIFAAGIEGATTVVEHLDDILNVVKAVAVAYGSYRAAVVLNTLATKGYTGVALIDNTVRKAKIALLNAEASLTGQTKAKMDAMTAAQEAQTAALQKQLTAEELAIVQMKQRNIAISGLLTAQQQQYLSNLNLTTSSAQYEAVATSVMTAEQKEALNKVELTTKSAAYLVLLEQEVNAKNQLIATNTAVNNSTLNGMRAEVKAAAQKVRSTSEVVVAKRAALQAAQQELQASYQVAGADAYQTAQKKVAKAQEELNIAVKEKYAAKTDFLTKKKALETAAIRQSTAASTTDTAAKTTQTGATTLLATATNKCAAAVKTLWAAFKTNPLGWVLTAVGLVMSAFTLFKSKSEEATDASGEFQEAVNKETNQLDMLFAILQNTEKGTKTHKDAIEKINAICKEYNKTLLDENATLEEQKIRYNELTTAIQNATAEKIKAKYIEKELQDYIEDSDKIYERLNKNIENAVYATGKKTTVRSGGDTYQVDVVAAADNIRKMGDEVKDAIKATMEDEVKGLSQLSGDAFTQQYNQVVSQIMASTQAATKATDMEMASFKGIIEGTLNGLISRYQTFDGNVKNINESMELFFSPKDPTPVTDSTNYVEMSFADLEQKAKDTQKEIDNINAKQVKVDTDNTKLLELQKLLTTINGAINTKTNNLNTEAGISARIKELKDKRSEAVIGSSDYKSYEKQIAQLEAKLPKHTSSSSRSKSANTAANNADALRQKQLEADRKLEEARIEVMDEGYAKRKAKLELQHKQSLAQIDKEEKELEKARKKAGKGGLTQNEKAGFDERRALENQSYTKQEANLFDGEIDYKKKQYELYFRWVRNMGQEVADAHFSKLLQDGNSYKQYVENQIQKLKEKQANGTLTEGESNQLITLNMQYDEITGAKSAMDSFKESVTRTINQASTLAEKLEAIAAARAKIDNGTSGLVGDDEKAEASLFLSEEDEKNQKELQDRVLTQYRTFEEQKKSIQDEYALLRKTAQEMNDQERLAQINKAEAQELSALNATFLKQSASWSKLFQDMDSLSVAEIEKLIKDIESQLDNADLKLNPVDYKAVIDSLNQAKEALVQKNPFKALGTYYDDFVKAKEKAAKARADVLKGTGTWDDVDKAEKDEKEAAKGITNSIEEITSVATECGTSIADMFDALGNDSMAEGLGTAVELMGQLGNAGASVGRIMSGDVVGGITGLVSSVASVVGIFAQLHDKKYEKRIQTLQKEIDALEQSYNRLERAFNNTYWVFTDSQEEAYEKNVQLIKDQISALEEEAAAAKKSWRFGEYSKINKEIKELNNTLNQTQEQGDMLHIYEAQKESLRQQQEDIQKQIDAENAKKKTDSSKIQSYQEQIESIEEQIEDLDQAMMETLAGTDVQTAIDEFADALVDAYLAGEDAAEALGKKTKEILKNAVVEALKRNYLAKGIDEAVKYLGSDEVWADNMLDENEQKKFESLVNAAGDNFTKYLSALDGFVEDTEDAEDPLTGAVTSMSEETGGVIAGRLNAFVINQSEQTQIIKQALVYQKEIAENTRYCVMLESILATLKRMETKDNSLLSQGVA